MVYLYISIHDIAQSNILFHNPCLNTNTNCAVSLLIKFKLLTVH